MSVIELMRVLEQNRWVHTHTQRYRDHGRWRLRFLYAPWGAPSSGGCVIIPVDEPFAPVDEGALSWLRGLPDWDEQVGRGEELIG